jgi:hypothetical protein
VNSLILLLSLSCPNTIIENRTEFPWNSFDNQTLTKAKKRCGEKYKNSKCVKVFRKTGEQDYQVICGREE